MTWTMVLKKIKTEVYLLKKLASCDDLAERLNGEFFELAEYNRRDSRRDAPSYLTKVGGRSFSVVSFNWKFPETFLTFNFSYTMSSPGSYGPNMDFGDIKGLLRYVEGTDQTSLDQIDGILEENGLSTKGEIREVSHDAEI